MKTIDFPQRSPEWFEARRGLPTASRFDQILTPAKGEPSKAQETLINELIAECLTEAGEDRRTAAMEAGNLLEDEARAAYELDHAEGLSVQQVGLLLEDSGRFGGSPDSLVGEDGGLEIKCPIAATQVAYVRAGLLPSDYRCQVHGHLVVTGRAWWDFFSYHRGLPSLRVRVTRDEFTDKLSVELGKFCAKYNEARARFGLAPLDPFKKELAAKV